MAEIRDGQQQKKDFWKAPDFKEKTKKIRETRFDTEKAPQPILPKTNAQEDFGIRHRKEREPSIDTTDRGRGTNRNSAFYESDQAIRDRVTNEVMKMPVYVRGASPDQIKKFVENKVQEQIDSVRQPRYIMTSDGRPFYLTPKDERKAYVQSLAGEPEGRKKWMLFKYDAARTVARTLQWLGEPSLIAKEAITDEDVEGNFAGALAQWGYNAAILGVEHVRAALSSSADQGQVERFRRDAEAVKYTNPELAATYLHKAEQIQKQVDFSKTTADRIAVAKAATRRAWEALNTEAKEVPEAFQGKDRNSYEARHEYVQSLMENRELAQKEAGDFRAQAQQAYAQGNYEQAIQLTKQAQEADRRGDPADSYGAYTWIREPERYEAFLEDAALVEMQKGAPLDQEEIRRLKDYHTNGWTEIGGELIFDPLNIVPSSVMEDLIKIPISTAKKGLTKLGTKLVKEVPELAQPVQKAVHVLGSPVRWLRREAVSSGGNRIARITHNLFDRISNAYTTTDDLVKAVDEIGDVVLDARRAPDQTSAEAIFNGARNRVPGLQNVTFREFKGLMDASDNVDPTQWGKMLSNSLGNAEEYLTETAARRGIDVSEVLSDLSKKRFALQDMAAGFQRAFVDPHRIYKGSSFTDDTIAGWVTKTLRELSGQEVNDLVKASKVDEAIIKYGETLSPVAKSLVHDASAIVEKVLHVSATARDVWAGLVLSTPRWIVGNLMDTAMRDVVWGGNLFDDLGTLLTSTHRTFVDELGINPIEFSQSLSRIDLDFSDNVTNRILYENWRPGANPFSYWAYEFKRLKGVDAQLAKHNIMSGLLANMPDGKFKNAMFWLGDGMSMVTPGMLFKTTQGAISDFNTAIEFTFRMRMFHREYFKLLNTLEPSFLARGLDGLSPATREIAQQIWKLSEGNPRRLSAYVDNIVGKAKNGTPAQWALTVPGNIEQVTRGMDAVDRQLFISQVRASLDDVIQASLRSGKQLDAGTFNKFFDDYKVKLQDEIQAHMSQIWDKRQAENVIGKDGIANPAPTAADFKGSAPIPADRSPRVATIEEATKRLRKSNRFRKITDVAQDFEAAVIDYAKVQRVPGDGIRLVNRGGEKIIELGDNVLKGKTVQLYEKMHDVVLQVFKTLDEDAVLRGGFNNLDEYENAVRRFIAKPADVLNTNERQFLTIADQLTANPQLKEMLARTNKEFDYATELEVYKNFSRYDDGYGFSRPPEEILQELANEKIVVPGAHVAASHEEVIATKALGEVYINPNIPEATRVKIGTFMEQMDVYRKQMRQFWTFVSPGPKTLAAGEGRRKAWDAFYNLGTDAYLKEAKIKTDLVKLFETDPAAAEKLLDEAQENFADWFLKQNGVEVTWDADRNVILNTKITRNGKTQNLASRLDNAAVESYFYRPQIQKQMRDNPVLRVDLTGQVNIRTSTAQVLRDTFQMPTDRAEAWSRVIENHAKKWAQETGQDVSKYYERLGFQKVEGGLGIGQVRGNNSIRLVKRGAVNRDESGKFIFYGLGHSNFESMVRETGELFYDDLISMAEHSKQAADDLDALRSYIEKQTGKKIIGGVLNQEQSQLFTEMFTRYVAEGVGPDIKLKKPFEKFKGWLNGTFEAVHTSPLGTELSDDIYRTMDRMFIESKIMDVPQSNNRTVQLIAKEAGMEYDEETLLKIINESIADPERGKLIREQADLNKQMWAVKTREELAPIQERLRQVDELLNPSSAKRAELEENLRLAQESNAAMQQRLATSKSQPWQAPAPKELPPVGDNYRRPLSDFADVLYRETSPSKARELIPGSNMMTDPGELYFANTPDLATGQGANKGIMLEFEPGEIQGQVNRSKPTWHLSYEQGQAEFVTRNNTQKQYQDAVRSVTISPNAQNGMDLRILRKQMEQSGWVKTTLPDGSIKYTKPDTRMYDAFMQGYGHEVRNLELDLEDAQKALDDFDTASKVTKSNAYSNLGDVPKDIAARVLGEPDNPIVAKVVSEIDEAFTVWKTNRGLRGFPEDALQSPDTLKAYLKDRIAGEWGETAQQYNRILWEVETFENAMLNYHAGDDFATHLFPRIPETEISDGMKTWVRNNDEMLGNYEAAMRGLDEWKTYMNDVVKNGHPSATLTKEQLTELNNWSVGASKDKAEMIDLMLSGGVHNGRDIEGSIDKVNRVMLDYQSRSVFDSYMKNFFPFWMFPSRSFPFWAETMATHPQLIANYEKIQRLSRTQRYQMGAITSSGKPLPSLDGYIPIPGTDLWFNPLAPFSFRYALDVAKSLDNLVYQANTAEEDVEPKAFMVKEFMQVSQVYSFSVAPWMTFLMKEAFNLPDEVVPRYPLLPQISLIPRWMVPDMIRLGNKTISTHKDQWYPEASWHDYMVERKLLEDALVQIRSGNLSEAEKLALMSKTQEAIKNKGTNEIWAQGYKDLTNSETGRSWTSFFTGFYPKPFTDGQAELLKVRNELNLMKSALNNEFQSNIFELPEDADAAWENYLKKMDTPDGWAHRLYTDIGWVRNELGEQVSNPQERSKYLAIKIEQDEKQQLYYQRMSDLQTEYNKRLRALPVGATYDQMKPVWDWYAGERGRLQSLREFEKTYGTNKPTELIQRGIRNEWFHAINETRPTWNVTNGETYEQYQERVADWEKNIPNVAKSLMNEFRKDNTEVNMTIAKLKPDQGFDTGAFFASLLAETNVDGVNAWEMENDDVFDALNKAWKETYWNEYWNSGVLNGGYEADLAERDFYAKHPEPPSADELYAWIQNNYGDKFTIEEIKKWVDYTEVATIDDRTLSSKDNPEDYKMRQEVWNMLSWLGPGGRNREVFDDAFAANGGDPEWLTTWYQESGQAFTTKPEKMQAMYEMLKATIQELDLKPPSRTELVRYVQAQEENDKFKEAVTGELGESFYDLLDYYNNLDTKAKKEFQGEQSAMYEVIESYTAMREAYVEDHPLWAEYFGFDLQPTVVSRATNPDNVAPVYTGTPNPKARKGSSHKKPVGYLPGGSSKPVYRSSAPQFNIQSRVLSSFSPQFLQAVGTKLSWEITSLYSGNRRLSSAAIGFLQNLSVRHPEWSRNIRDILARNGS